MTKSTRLEVTKWLRNCATAEISRCKARKECGSNAQKELWPTNRRNLPQ
ncbi:hypothetical protein CaCOL14_006904 [Colletotrichum acutatum]